MRIMLTVDILSFCFVRFVYIIMFFILVRPCVMNIDRINRVRERERETVEFQFQFEGDNITGITCNFVLSKNIEKINPKTKVKQTYIIQNLL